MKYNIQHKTTGEIRSGQWDSEYLNFLSDQGNIDWMEYSYWEPCEMSIMELKTTKFETILSIHNPYFLIDMIISTRNGRNINITVPFKMDRFTKSYIVLKPLFGTVNFKKVSFFGKVYGSYLRSYQLPENESMVHVNEFIKMEHQICHSCLGHESKYCMDC